MTFAYLKIGLAVAVAALIAIATWYVGDLRTQVAAAVGQISAKDATINEQAAAAKRNLQAITDLQMAKDRAEAALTAEAGQRQAITNRVNQIKEQVRYVQVPPGICRAADARDIATLDGVRGLLYPAAGGADPNGQNPASGGTDGGHSAVGAAESTRQP